MNEIERKFLVLSDQFIRDASGKKNIVQGYLNSNKARAVRVRMCDNKGFLTVKGPTDHTGTTRLEWEIPIEEDETKSLLTLCEPGIIEKTRYTIPVGNHSFEVDIFHGENSGLVLAEIELQSPDEDFIKPLWLGKEVTGEEKYYNAYLSKHPFRAWP